MSVLGDHSLPVPMAGWIGGGWAQPCETLGGSRPPLFGSFGSLRYLDAYTAGEEVVHQALFEEAKFGELSYF